MIQRLFDAFISFKEAYMADTKKPDPKADPKAKPETKEAPKSAAASGFKTGYPPMR